jgi:hypothetical protein
MEVRGRRISDGLRSQWLHPVGLRQGRRGNPNEPIGAKTNRTRHPQNCRFLVCVGANEPGGWRALPGRPPGADPRLGATRIPTVAWTTREADGPWLRYRYPCQHRELRSRWSRRREWGRIPIAHQTRSVAAGAPRKSERTRAVPPHELTRDPQECWIFPLVSAQTNPAGESLCLILGPGISPHRRAAPADLRRGATGSRADRSSVPPQGVAGAFAPLRGLTRSTRHGFPRSHGPTGHEVDRQWLRYRYRRRRERQHRLNSGVVGLGQVLPARYVTRP